MKIDSISFLNYKVFKGECTIRDLSNNLNNGQNIILLGGLNGAGKTSIFEAILLCLYGKKNRTLWPSKGAPSEGYESYIISIINDQIKISSPCPEMRIKISLKDIETRDHPYEAISIERSWKIIKNNEIEDNFSLFNTKDEPLETIPEESWEAYIEEIIPYEIHQFFFFDGEKIQDFIKDEDRHLEESLSKVLGISLYQQLKTDLETAKKYITREEAKGRDLGLEIKRKDLELKEIENEIFSKKGEVKDKRERINNINRELDDISRETSRINPGTKGDDEKSILESKDQLKEKENELKQEMSQFIELDLIFLFMGGLSSELKNQLLDERKKLEFEAKQKALKPKIYFILNKLFSDEESKPPLQDGQKKFYKNKLNNILENILMEDEHRTDNVQVIHGLSENDSNDVISKIGNISTDIEPINKITKELNRIGFQLAKIEKAESSLSGPGIQELFETKGQLEQERKQIEEEIDNLEIEIDELQTNTTSLKKEITNKEKEVKLNPERERQRDYIEQIINTLDDFSDKFRSTRVNRLEELSYQIWNKLAHKKGLVNKIMIDKKIFSIKLINTQGQLLDKTKLSAGEKEILALSLIWSLGKLTDRNLPVVIDTPLGRLDREHRESIAENYFSDAGEQVFLLSTNEEIVRKEYEVIKTYLSKKYIIKHNQDLQTSAIREGYFD